MPIYGYIWGGPAGPTPPGPLLYQIGGENQSNSANSFDGSSWSAETDTPFSSSDGSVARPIGTNIYHIAGRKNGSYTNRTDRYDGSTWYAELACNNNRGFGAGFVVNNKVGVAGGYNGSSRLSSLEEYDGTVWQVKSNMPSPARTTVGDNYRDFGVTIGGDSGSVVADFDQWNGSSWTSLTNIVSPSRTSGGAAGVGSRVYYAFGTNGSTALADIDYYDGSWTSGTNHSTAHNEICDGGSEYSGNAHFIGGRTNGNYLTNNDSYNGTSWTADTALTTGTRNTACCSMQPLTGSEDSRAYVFGGNGPSGGGHNKSVSYDGTTWRTEVAAIGPEAGQGGSASYDSRVFKICGGDFDPSTTLYNDTVSYDGSSWNTHTDFIQAQYFGAATNYDGYIHYTGGKTSGDNSSVQTTHARFDGYTWTTLTSIPSPARAEHSASELGSGYNIYGGFQWTGSVTPMTDNDYWNGSWSTATAVTSPARYSCGMGGNYSSAMYAMTGYSSSMLADNDSYSGGTSGSWTNNTDTPSPTRYHAVIYEMDTFIGLVNGYNSTLGSQLLDNDQWSGSWTTGTDASYLSTLPYRGTITIIPPTDLGKFYGFGGNESSTVFGDCYSCDGDTWFTETDLLTSLLAPTGAYCNGRLHCAYGTTTTAGNYITDNTGYDGNSWTDFTNGVSPSRAYCGSVSDGYKLYSVGGFNGSAQIQDFDAFDGYTWASLTSLPSPIRSLPGCFYIDSEIHAVGGFNSGTPLSDHDVYTGSWASSTAYSVTVYGPSYGETTVGYICSGEPSRNDFYSWDGSWNSLTDLPSPTRYEGGGAGRNNGNFHIYGSNIDDHDYYDGSWNTGTDYPDGHSAIGFGQLYTYELGTNDFVYAAFGRSGSYTQDAYRWTGATWLTESDGPSPTRFAGSGAVINQRFYYSFGENSSGTKLQDCDSYDGVWRTETSGPTPARYFTSGAAVDDTIYVTNGLNVSGKQDHDAFDSCTWTNKTDRPTPAVYASAAFVIGSNYYVVGGYSSSTSTYYRDFDQWDGSSWSSLSDIVTPARAYHGGTTHDGSGYLIGGLTTGGTTLNDVDSYNGSWTNEVNLPSPNRGYVGCGYVDETIFCFGGYTTVNIADNDGYDGTSWLNYIDCPASFRSPGYANISLPIPVEPYKSKTHIVGGQDSGGRISDNDYWNGSWSSATSIVSPARSQLSAGAGQIDSNGWVIGGRDGSGNYLQDCDGFDGSSWSNYTNTGTNRGEPSVASVDDSIVYFAYGYDGSYVSGAQSWNGDAHTTETSPISPNRTEGYATEQNGIFCVTGGQAPSVGQIQDFDAYDGNTWSSWPDSSSPARQGGVMGTVQNIIYYATGVDSGSRYQDCDSFNGATWVAETDIPSPARNSGIGKRWEDKFLVTAGVTTGTYVADNDHYDGSSWSSETDLISPLRGGGPGSFAF